MSEGSEDAAILIATSFQALNRVLEGGPHTLITDCTVIILFAGFYVEATLNHILENTQTKQRMVAFPLNQGTTNVKRNPGMRDKLAWFYNEFVEAVPASNWREINANGIDIKLEESFPGFTELYRFRNDISHSRINHSAKSIENARRVRKQAKDLVGQLYIIALSKGFTVPRLITYKDAIASLTMPPSGDK